MQWEQKGIIISDDTTRVNLEVVHTLLQQSYWANTRTKATIAQTLEHSLCFAVLKDQQQIGFARVVTDYTTFAWICDVIIDPRFRGQGVGKFLMRCVTEHPAIASTKQLLATKDAHSLYEQFNFIRKECMWRDPKTLSK